MKIISWNVNGIRAFYKKGQFEWLQKQDLDIICLQETKATVEQLPKNICQPEGYFGFFDSSKTRKGYSGVAIYSKIKPEKVTYGLGIPELDQEGRQINLFFKDMVVINCYFPNGGGAISRQIYKQEYYNQFLKFVQKLQKKYKKIVFCGDVNVAHEEIDIARPKENQNEVGFLPEERFWLDEVLESGFVDTFREMHPKKVQYSWWDMKTRARDRNIGWRIDYFFITQNLKKDIKKAIILDEVLGSDHAPIFLELK